MGKRKKAKPLLAVQGIVHLTESFVQPSQESGLLTTVGGNEECRGLILAPNYGYAISASSLAKKSEEKEVQEEENVTNNDDGDGDKKADTENIENETPGTSKSEEAAKEELSVAELVRHIGGAKDKPLAKGDIVEDRPESERPQQTPKEVEQDDFETTEFYESLGISRPNQAKKPVVETLKISNENEIREGTKNVSEFVQSIPESIADYYKNYTQYYYSKPSDPYGSQPLEFSRPVPASEEADSEIDYSIIEIAIRVQKAKREHEAKKTELGKLKTNKTEEVETPYDPLPMEITPSENLKALPEDSNLATYWKYVEENPHDFHRWAYLISYTETTGLLNETRKVYSAFLPLFPYCFGYWKRYSDIEKGHSYLQRALMILQRGLEFIPLSVDLWISYLTLFAEINAHNKDFQELLREQYENGINNAGMEFRSDALWDSYIQWEINLQNRKRAFVLYKRLLQVPTRLYNRHWDNAKILIRDHHPRDFLSYDDYDAVRKKGCKALGFKYKAEPEIESGEIRKTIKPEDKLMAYIKERVLENLSKIQTKTQLEADKRWDFEDKVKRPYFHVKALDKSQLYNWENYLNFEIKEGNHDRVVLLFERCLIACANYERFWCKYARYLEKYHRFHPELNAVSTHLQPSKVNLEIVSTKEAVEEEELISSVREVLQSLVDAVMEAETLETIAVKNTMESILFTLDDPPDPVSVVKEVMQIILYQLEDEDARTIERLTSHHVNTDPSSEGSLVPGNLNGHSENTCSELPLNSGSNSNHSTSSDFSALMKIPDFPPAKYRWHEVVRDIYKRASLIHCARKPTVRLQWASFEEEIGKARGKGQGQNFELWKPQYTKV